MVNWESTTIGELLEFKNGLNKGKEFFGKGTPIVNYMDVYKHRGIHAEQLRGRVTLSTEEIRRFDVHKGDVFFTRTSETPEEVGYAGVMLDEIDDCVFSGFVLRGRPTTDKLDIGYCQYAFMTEEIRKAIMSGCTYTTRASICSDVASLNAVGQFTLTSGEIAYNSTDGVLIAVNTFTMSGGEIHHNISNAMQITGLINPGMGKSEVSGGSISDNYSNAGVIELNGGTLIISGGEITRNISSNYTGGINVSGSVINGRQYPAKVRMSSGRIYDNEVRYPMPASYWMATLGYNQNSHYEKAGNNLILHEMYAEQYVSDAMLEMSGGQIYSRRGLSRNSSIVVSGTKSKATLSGKAEVETSRILVQNGGKLTDKRK